MAKASIAITAFILGLCCSAFFSPAQPQKQTPSAPLIQWPDMHGNIFHGGGFKGQGPSSIGIDLDDIGAIPVFNSLDHLPTFEEFKLSSVSQRLDGLNCVNCTFDNAVLRYGGGAINLKGSTFSGKTELQLEGAAANTVALLEFLNAIPKQGLKYKLPLPNRPIRKVAPATTPVKMDFTAPYIGPR